MEISGITQTANNDPRVTMARAWLQGLNVSIQSDFNAVAGDASFRRYFRLMADGVSRILMDAPPPGEDVTPFIDISRRLRSAGLHAPEIIHADQHNGFLLLEDLGDDLYRELLNPHNANDHFPQLFYVLKRMALTVDITQLPGFNTRMLRADMDLFPDWYIAHHRKTMSHKRLDGIWDKFCGQIISSALDQPQCFVHRDFHSCNLLKTSTNSVSIIDFQDAVYGPISYDFISLIWDRYIRWPRTRIETWMEEIRQIMCLDIEPGQWRRYCDLMGLQRNFKIVGIFARLYYRDGKTGYIEMIPRFYDYLTSTLRRYPEFSDVLDILEQPECVP